MINIVDSEGRDDDSFFAKGFDIDEEEKPKIPHNDGSTMSLSNIMSPIQNEKLVNNKTRVNVGSKDNNNSAKDSDNNNKKKDIDSSTQNQPKVSVSFNPNKSSKQKMFHHSDNRIPLQDKGNIQDQIQSNVVIPSQQKKTEQTKGEEQELLKENTMMDKPIVEDECRNSMEMMLMPNTPGSDEKD
jgi:hypothetical protein